MNQSDIAKLLLRVTLGGLMLFHGVAKIIHGVGGIKSMLAGAGLPQFLAYGVFLGEVVAPILILLGLYARIASLVVGGTMVMAIFLAHGSDIFSLGKHGAPAIELPLMFLMMSIVVFLLGSGKWAVNNK